MADEKMKLYYFDFAGKAQMLRYAFEAGKIPYEEIRFSRDEWPKYKSMSPTGKAPFVTIPGVDCPMVESLAILMFICQQAEMVPKCPTALGFGTILTSLGEDFVSNVLIKAKGLQESEKAQFSKDVADKIYTHLDMEYKIWKAFYPAGASPYLTGDEMSFADLYFTTSIEMVSVNALFAAAKVPFEELEKRYPEFIKVVRNVWSNPEINKYNQKHNNTFAL